MSSSSSSPKISRDVSKMLIGYMATKQGQRKLDLLLEQREVQHTTAMIACIMKNNNRNKANRQTAAATPTSQRIPSTIGIANNDASSSSALSHHSDDDESHHQEQDHSRQRRSTLLFDESNRDDEEVLFGEIGW